MSQLPSDSYDFSSVISALYIYPIKSCAGVQVNEVFMTETGFEFDRAWMVVDDKGEFLTQRELPKMELIQPQLKHYEMVLRAPGMLALHIKLDEVEAPARVRVWGDEVAAFDMGKVAAQWFTDYLGTTARLVRFDPDHQRVCNSDWTQGIHALNQFSDGFPVLVISEASLAQLNDKLVAKGSPAVSMSRFRPNIVLGASPDAGEMTAHDEDRLDVLHISTGQGSFQLKPVKPCARCPIPNIDPVTALSTHDVGDMLQTYRSDPRVDGAVTFGMNAVVIEGFEQVLKTGQMVTANYSFD
ncbi:MAG: MOSC N-terminal beta barrel domain-containing protein [Polaromonas sp.]